MSFSRRNLLLSPLARPLASLAQKKTGKTNVLMFAVDDLNTRIGCYGDPLVKTPNLDRLAGRSVRFERAYCNYPLCNPSRTVLLSGKRPETTRIHDNTLTPRTYLGNAVFLPEYFKAHGYFTARVGKVAHFEQDVHWDISENDAPEQLPEDLRRQIMTQRQAAQKKGPPQHMPADITGDNPNARPLMGGVGGMPWRATDNPDEKEGDGKTARRISQIITEHKDEPFFIACGFRKPHVPLFAPRKYFDMYKLDDIKLPETPADDRGDIPPLAMICTNRDNLKSDEERRQVTLAYHACTTFMDAQLGVVLDTVDRQKLWDNTVVILWADHGWHLYDHLQLWGKITQFEEAAHVPLIVHAPGKLAGVSSQRLVEWIDIYPTLTELCGLPPAPGLDGSSVAPLLSDPERAWKKAAYTMNWRGGERFGRGIRTDRYRYTEWSEGKDGVELYDHRTDPHEWTNLAMSPKTTDVREELRELLRHGQKTNVPPRG
jgi:iduronate 2-sulfatase